MAQYLIKHRDNFNLWYMTLPFYEFKMRDSIFEKKNLFHNNYIYILFPIESVVQVPVIALMSSWCLFDLQAIAKHVSKRNASL
jgi:hypothetical protein